MNTPTTRPVLHVSVARRSAGVLAALILGGSLAAPPAIGAEDSPAEQGSAEQRASTTSGSAVRRHTSLCDVGTCYLGWYVADTDRDGVADADELVMGTDPDDPRRLPAPAELIERVVARELPSFEAGLGTVLGLPEHMVESRLSTGYPWTEALPLDGREALLDKVGVGIDGSRGLGTDPRAGFALGLGNDGRDGGMPPMIGNAPGHGEMSHGSDGVTQTVRQAPPQSDADGNPVNGTWYIVKDGDGQTTSETYSETVTYPDGSTRTETTVFSFGEDALGRPTHEASEPAVTTTDPTTGTTGGSAPADGSSGDDSGDGSGEGSDEGSGEGTDGESGGGTEPSEEDVNGDGVVDEEDEETYESPDDYGSGGTVIVGPEAIERALGKLDWNRTPSDPWNETTYTGGGDPQVPDDGSLIYPLPDGADSVLVLFGAGTGVTPDWNHPQPRTIDGGLDPRLPYGGGEGSPTGGGGCLECR